ncbi:MAG: tetratricopeptide repeat protein [Bacteroidetes bacterium]|nr:tetratricopeptide repeat protein [Bacteroidota bacterium]
MQNFFRKQTFLVLLLFCLNGILFSVHAQTKKEDSLVKVLKTQKDTARISTLLKLAIIHAKDTTIVPLNYLQEAYNLAKASGDKKYSGDYFMALARYKESKGDFDAVVKQYNEATKMYNEANYVHGQIEANYTNGIWHARNDKFRLANPLFLRASQLARASDNTKAFALNLYFYAKTFQSLGEHIPALKFYKLSLDIYIQRNDSDGMAKCYNAIGGSYKEIHDFTNAIANYVKAQKIYQPMGRKKDFAGCLVNIGNVYLNLPNEQKALDNYYDAEKILAGINDIEYLANVRHNIGNILMDQGKLDLALEKFEQTKEVFQQIGHKEHYAVCLGSIAEIYYRKKQYEKGLVCVVEALALKRESGDQDGICRYLVQGANFYLVTNRKKEAKINYEEALAIAKKISLVSQELVALKSLGHYNEEIGEYKLSADYYKQYADLKDTAFKKESTEKIAKMEALYKNEKQAAEIATLNQQQEAHENELKVSSLQKNMMLAGLIVLFVIIFLIFNRYRLKQRSNLQLQSAYDQIQINRDEIALQRKEIMDSIRYAKRIQEAILPPEGQLNMYFAEHFIYYLPKDIVSGDLYWFSKVKDTLMLAAVDCTGHGVPGAFMSVIGVDHLNHIINEKHITDPARVLTELDKTIFSSFAKNDEHKAVQDGMDVALCAVHLESKVLNFAGAHRPLIHIRNNVITELKATKASIGGYLGEGKIFVNESLQLQKGDCIYMFTDGYADQFGGPRGKKFKYKQLLELILENTNAPMEVQRQKLVNAFEAWKAWPVGGKGALEQVDDVCVIGIRV